MTERDDDASDHLADLTTSFLRATAELDTAALHVVIEDALRHHDVDTVIVDLLVPLMHRVGDLWEQGELSVLAEHAASAAVRSAVGDICRTPEADAQGTIVLACPPGELHDLPTHLFAAMLRERGHRTAVLGANVPWAAIARALRTHEADACVIASMRPHSLSTRGTGLRRMSHVLPVYVAGPAARGVRLPGVVCLPDDWRAALAIVTGDDGRTSPRSGQPGQLGRTGAVRAASTASNDDGRP